MRHGISLAAFATWFALAPTALAQQQPPPRDHRGKPDIRDHRMQPGQVVVPARPAAVAPAVGGFAPAEGAPGTVVTIRGRGLAGATAVKIGRQTVTPTSVTPRALTFAVPAMRPGPRPVKIVTPSGELDVGSFTVQPAAATPPVVTPAVPHAPPGTLPPPPPPVAVPAPPHVPPGTLPPPPVAAPVPPVAQPGGPGHGWGRGRHSRHDWRQGRAIVSSYFPQKGKAGRRVTVRGENFAADVKVVMGGQEIQPAKADATRIVFRLPDGIASGAIALRSPAWRRDVVVGPFEVVNYDAEAERARIEAERRQRAEEAWQARRSQLARDARERRAALERQEEQLRQSREERRRQRVERLQAKWKAAFLADPQTQAEMALHAERLARLERMRRVADAEDKGKLAVRIDVALDRENERHDSRMKALEAAFQMQ